LKTKKKRTTRKTRGFVVGAKILHLQTHTSKRTNTIVTREMNTNEKRLMIKRWCVRNVVARVRIVFVFVASS
jgi:hypothetical protein